MGVDQVMVHECKDYREFCLLVPSLVQRVLLQGHRAGEPLCFHLQPTPTVEPKCFEPRSVFHLLLQ